MQTIGQDELEAALRSSLDVLVSQDIEILDTTERVVLGRLMIYLSQALGEPRPDGFLVDLEYERRGQVVKRLHAERGTGPKIVPDLVVHRRKRNGVGDNLLVVEVKVVGRSTRDKLHDHAKLALLTRRQKHAYWYECEGREPSYLRRVEDQGSGGLMKGVVGLPEDMCPYLHGVFVEVGGDNGYTLTWVDDLPEGAGPLKPQSQFLTGA